MICQNCRSAVATGRYVYGQGKVRNLTTLCDGCRLILQGMGMDLRSGQPIAKVEDTRPAWLRNLRSKDFTGSIA